MRDSILHTKTDHRPCPGCGAPLRGLGTRCWAGPRRMGCGWTLGDEEARTEEVSDLPDDRSEKQIQTAIRKTLQPFDLAVYDLSQPRAAMQTPGLPDLYIVGYGTHLWAEVKKPGGRLSQAQKFFRETCRANGIPHAVWWSERDALEWVEAIHMSDRGEG